MEERKNFQAKLDTAELSTGSGCKNFRLGYPAPFSLFHKQKTICLPVPLL